MSVEQHNRYAWALCRRRGWEGPIRTSTVAAGDDETDHTRRTHPTRADRDECP